MSQQPTPGLGRAGRVISALFAIAGFIAGFIMMGSSFDGNEHSAWLFAGGLLLSCFVIFCGVQLAGAKDPAGDDSGE